MLHSHEFPMDVFVFCLPLNDEMPAKMIQMAFIKIVLFSIIYRFCLNRTLFVFLITEITILRSETPPQISQMHSTQRDPVRNLLESRKANTIISFKTVTIAPVADDEVERVDGDCCKTQHQLNPQR